MLKMCVTSYVEITQKMNIPFKYTGNGSFIIGFKNPDFVNINGKKICLELRHDGCHFYHGLIFMADKLIVI
jgi:hypothetical protein